MSKKGNFFDLQLVVIEHRKLFTHLI